MTYAAKRGLLYHLWWHPHNFGRDIEENFNTLRNILAHYKKLNVKYNFESKTMKETYFKISETSNKVLNIGIISFLI